MVSAYNFNSLSAKNNLSDSRTKIVLSPYSYGFDNNVGGLWILQPMNGSFRFQETLQNKCLDMLDKKMYTGGNMFHSECIESPRQLWNPLYVRLTDSAVQFQNVFTGLCLDASGGKTNSILSQRTCITDFTSPVIETQLWLTQNPSSASGISSPSGLSLPMSDASLSFSKLNIFSRHASLILSPRPPNVSWIPYFSEVLDQSTCGSCSIFGVVGSVEGVYNIITNSNPPLSLSEQQILDCSGSCSGTWPEKTMQYIANLDSGLALTKDYGAYQAIESTCHVVPGVIKVVSFEQVLPSNEDALMAAISQQPVVVYMTLTESFRNLTDWSIFKDPYGECAVGSPFSHIATIVGYGTEDNVNYWIVRNSFGLTWGVSGYGRILRGICGIGLTASIYPVLAPTGGNLCGPINPCGSGICTVSDNNTYDCTCPSNYDKVTNTDGTKTCATGDICSAASTNPCGAGACVNEGNGTYHCVCFAGYLNASNGQGQPICIAPSQNGLAYPLNYTVQSGDRCKIIALMYGITVLELSLANPTKNCRNLFPGDVFTIPGKSVTTCSNIYSVQDGDTCDSIESDLGLTKGSLSSDLNPGLDCGDPSFGKGQQICVEKGAPIESKVCIAMDLVVAADTKKKRCNSLRKRAPKLKKKDFFEVNRGINCNNLVAGQPFCTDYVKQPPQSCKIFYKWQKSDTCSNVIQKICGLRTTKSWKQCMGSTATLCIGTGSSWAVGRIICVKSCINSNKARVIHCSG